MDERIDDYFGQRLTGAEKAQFEADLKSDPQLADAVAFYLASREASMQYAREKKLLERHAEWQALPKKATNMAWLNAWYAVAAAVALVAFGIGWYFLNTPPKDMQQLAAGYVMENFTRLRQELGDSGDTLQRAKDSYNNGQYATALKRCESVLSSDPQNAEAKRIAGIVSLHLLDYDKAIDYFHRLGAQKELYANPGKFYEAIALIQRNQPGDKKKAESLLQEVIDQDLEGKNEAVKWMK
ncbi:tetratricopeptide repeat protein [Dyadobacter arcticus]|uniref:Tetratricopeptide (TPR) repeat protein n=1 Tax=Dyadobacter arcticus TaxID=1078754 RepID=A0ABX0US30_9BACT|nr:hypothetical protein [Dyadobacter arcticus]NIJ53781.1 tetratricopeptide (TPR) repeat protein [Dyadobacter arcticus]